jgi:hypothetical protein
MPKGIYPRSTMAKPDLPPGDPRIASLEARIAALEYRIARMNEAFARGYLPDNVRTDA